MAALQSNESDSAEAWDQLSQVQSVEKTDGGKVDRITALQDGIGEAHEIIFSP